MGAEGGIFTITATGKPEGGKLFGSRGKERKTGGGSPCNAEKDHGPFGGHEIIMESLILAQNERWRRVLSMQVGRQEGARPFLEWRTGE